MTAAEDVFKARAGQHLDVRAAELARGLLAEGAALALKRDDRPAGAHRRPTPSQRRTRGSEQADQVEHAVDTVVDEIVDGLRVVVKAGNRRGDNGAHFGQRGHIPQVPEVERAFADHQDQFTPLFQDDVGGADHEVGTDAAGDGGHGVDGAGGDDHGVGGIGSAGQAAGDILQWIGKIR